MTKSLLAAALLFACSHPAAQPAKPADPPPPTAAAPTCAAVSDHLMSLLKASPDAPREYIDKIGAIIAKHCESDAWSVEARTCLVGATMDTEDKCESMLTQAQQAAMEDEARRLAPPGATGGSAPTGGGAPPPAEPAPQPAMSPPPAPPPPPSKSRGPSKSRSGDPCEGGQ